MLSRNISILQKVGQIARSSVRTLMLQEHHGMVLLQRSSIKVPPHGVAKTPEDAMKYAKNIDGKEYVIKAQVLAGGRGKGRFDSGLQGGVQLVSTPEEAKEKAKQMIGFNLITKQTGERGRRCEEVLVCKKLSLRKEYYFGITLDRATSGPVLIGSSRGGVNIEEVAATDPSAIVTVPVNPNTGITPEIAADVATKMGFKDDCKQQAQDIITKLYNLFVKSDATLIEINPMAEDVNGDVYCMDCKILVDTNAEFRQKELFAWKDTKQEDPLEVKAEAAGLNYIRLDGNIGCLVNGAGLAMATMDIIKLRGGEPANFLDVGGGVTEDQVLDAFEIISSDPHVKGILVNIFGGIVNCETIASGIIKACHQLKTTIPMVVRLEGTNVDAAKEAFKKSGLPFITASDLDDAAQKVVAAIQKP